MILLRSMSGVLEMKRDDIKPEVASDLIALCTVEMTRESEVSPQWQEAASNCLVVLGRRFCTRVMATLMAQFKSGVLPHYFVMKTMADLSAANQLEVVPSLRDAMARTIPVLGAIKQDNLRWVFSSALAKFAEAIMAHVHNIEDETERNAQQYAFSAEMFTAFDLVFTNWTTSGNRKVRLAAFQAVGHMCALMKPEAFEAQVPKVIPALLAMYKKEKEADFLPITQSLSSILEVGSKTESNVLGPFITPLLTTLHPMVCKPVNYSEPSSFKNQHELLRCFEVLAKKYTDEVVNYLLRFFDLQKTDPLTREGTINVLRHCVNSLNNMLASKKELIISGLQPLTLHEPSWTVKKGLAQLVVAMAPHGYLELEGGEAMVEFIVKNCSITDDEIDKFKAAHAKQMPATTPADLRQISDHILNLMTTTVPSSHQVLWPFLLEPLTKPNYGASVSAVCKAIAFIGQIKRTSNTEDFLIDFDKKVNLPKPQQIMARLLVLLNAPLRRDDLGNNILEALLNISGILHPSITEMWDRTIPRILEFLRDNADSWNQTTWEDLVLRLLTETIKVIADVEWTMKLGDAFSSQLALYKTDPELKRVCFKHFGIVIGSVTHKEWVKDRLDSLWNEVNHENDKERTGAAQAFGYTAAAHLDFALEKLAQVVKPPEKKKPEPSSGGLFGGLFGGGSKEAAAVPAGAHLVTITLAYGYITAYAKPSIITSRIDGHIMANIKPYLATKNATLREGIIKTTELIAKAMLPSHLKMKYEFKFRDELLQILLGYTTADPKEDKKKAVPISNSTRVLALNAATVLINLDPPLPTELETRLLEIATKFYALPDSSEDKSELVFDNMNKMLSMVIYRDTSILRLRSLVGQLAPYVRSSSDVQRSRAMTTILYLMKRFVEYVSEADARNDTKFDQLGDTLAIFLPRSTDPSAQVRSMSIEAAQLALYLDHILKLRMESKDPELAPPDALRPLTELRKRSAAGDLNEQLAVVMEVSAILADTVSIKELGSLLNGLIKGLNDSQESSARGTCVVLFGLVSQRAKDLHSEVSKLVTDLCEQMASINNDSTLNGTLNALKQLAITHTSTVLEELLARPMPHPDYLSKAFQVLAIEPKISEKVFFHLMNCLNNNELFETIIVDKAKKTTKLQPTSKALSATAALSEIFEKPEAINYAESHYAHLFSTLALRIGSSVGFKEAIDPSVAALKHFVSCTQDDVLLAAMASERGWETLAGPNYLDVLPMITSHICKTRQTCMPSAFSFLLPSLKAVHSGQRLVTATVLGEFINHTSHDTELLAKLINAMLSCMINPELKIAALNGLSNITSGTQDQQDMYATTILDALMSGVEDPFEPVALAALSGLARVVVTVDDRRVAPIIINLCHRLRPLLDRPSAAIRASASALVGKLARFGTGPAKSQFVEQCHDLLPSFLLHINDDDESVKVACKTTMVAIASFLDNEEIEKLFTGPGFDPNRPLNYDDFIHYLSKFLIAAFPNRLNYYLMTAVEPYFKSEWSVIRGSAATFVGALLGNIPKEKRQALNLNPSRISKALVVLMAESSPLVRKKAAYAISLLHTY